MASFHQDHTAQGVADQDIVGRTESGAMGFGLIGTAVAQVARNVASGLAFAGAGYGMYTTFVGNGQEIALPANTPPRLSLKERETEELSPGKYRASTLTACLRPPGHP